MTASRDIRTLPDGTILREIAGGDPEMRRIADLCYETLHRPYGVVRNDAWNETDPASVHVVAMRDGRIVAYARLIAGDRWSHVRQVLVEPGHRGAGLASAIVAELVELARERGDAGVYLHARRRAVRMYERLGFRVVGETFRMPRTWLPHVRMERPFRG